MRKISLLILVTFFLSAAKCQPIPGKEENIDFLVTVGKDSKVAFRNDAKSQSEYILIPSDFKRQVFIRIFDPDIGNENDISFNEYNSQVKYEIFGGSNEFWDGNINKNKFNSETSPLFAKTFDSISTFDNSWTTLCTLQPSDGVYYSKYDAYVFKLLVNGIKGDDYNCFRVFISTSSTENNPIEGANSFRYKTTCLLKDPPEFGHIYPYYGRIYDKIELNISDLQQKKTLPVERINELDVIRIPYYDNLKSSLSRSNSGINKSTSLDLTLGPNKNLHQNNHIVHLEFIVNDSLYLQNFSRPIGGVPRYYYEPIMEPIDE